MAVGGRSRDALLRGYVVLIISTSLHYKAVYQGCYGTACQNPRPTSSRLSCAVPVPPDNLAASGSISKVIFISKILYIHKMAGRGKFGAPNSSVQPVQGRRCQEPGSREMCSHVPCDIEASGGSIFGTTGARNRGQGPISGPPEQD